MTRDVDATEAALSPEQDQRALEMMREYLNAPPNSDGAKPWQVQAALGEDRRRLIAEELKPLLDSYLAGRTDLADFRSTVDGLNKRHEYWGFKGIKGQMFFNMVVNVADALDECDQELKAALAEPENEEIGRSRLRTFISYVKRLGEQHVEAGGSADLPRELAGVVRLECLHAPAFPIRKTPERGAESPPRKTV